MSESYFTSGKKRGLPHLTLTLLTNAVPMGLYGIVSLAKPDFIYNRIYSIPSVLPKNWMNYELRTAGGFALGVSAVTLFLSLRLTHETRSALSAKRAVLQGLSIGYITVAIVQLLNLNRFNNILGYVSAGSLLLLAAFNFGSVRWIARNKRSIEWDDDIKVDN
eukprot:TRINITY_DN26878_c0_g1_i1.p1 TRINITY_DN26878_c0_g1~~TRINITY_DN26878_c0_g1_i1.p1  ORF type:complete len:163 (-),score=19.32 TRINITY_DN26878_c0_g1_i1:23-511(-)